MRSTETGLIIFRRNDGKGSQKTNIKVEERAGSKAAAQKSRSHRGHGDYLPAG